MTTAPYTEPDPQLRSRSLPLDTMDHEAFPAAPAHRRPGLATRPAIDWLPTHRSCGCPHKRLNCLSKTAWLEHQAPIWCTGDAGSRPDRRTGRDSGPTPSPFPAAPTVPSETDEAPSGNAARAHTTAINCANRRAARALRAATRSANHPAPFPLTLAQKVLATYSHPGETVLDPFCGVGTTLVAATSTGRHAVGLDLNADYVAAARGALASVGSDGTDGAGGGPDSTTGRARMKSAVLRADARTAAALLPPSSIDLVFTSPPYWDMLKQRQARRNRRAKRYIKHNYSTDPHDLSNAITLPEFYGSLRAVFRAVRSVLKPGARCVINIGDYRRRGRFIPLHARCISIMEDLGFELNNIIFWDRRQRYRVGVFGYPNRFMTSNGMVEYLLEFQKPGGRPERGRRAGVS